MQKSKSGMWMYSKVLYILPMATLALSAFATVGSSNLFAGVAESGSVTDSEDKVSTFVADLQGNGPENVFGALPLSDNTSMVLVDVGSKIGKYDADSTARTTWTKVNFCTTPEHLPEFPGGMAAMMEYLSKTVKYPAEAIAAGVQGRVLVEFFVNDDGSVGTIGFIRPVGFGGCSPKDDSPLADVVVADHRDKCRAQDKGLSAEEEAAFRAGVEAIINEAVRVVKEMPRWTPGYEDKAKTKSCVTRFTLPIVFRLS